MLPSFPRLAGIDLAAFLAIVRGGSCEPAWVADWDLAAVKAVNQGLASAPADDAAVFLTYPAVTGGAVALVALGGTPADLRSAATGLATEGIGAGLAEGFKAVTMRPRPYLVDPSIRTPAGRDPYSSMPSGPTTVAFAAATVLALDHSRFAPYGFAVATFIGLSRVYEGVHYPTDVLAGAALGALVGYGVVTLRNGLQARGWLPALSQTRDLQASERSW